MRKNLLRSLCVLALCLAAGAEEIHLKDGTRITGQVTGVSGDAFTVKTAYGEMQVPRAQIVSISFVEGAKDEKAAAKPEQAAGEPAAKRPPQDDELKDGKYVNRTTRVEFQLPRNWKAVEALTGPDIVAAFQSDDLTKFLYLTPEEYEGDMTNYIALLETSLQTTLKDYKKTSQEPFAAGDIKGLRVVVQGKLAAVNDTPIRFVVYVFPDKGRYVRLSFMTVESLYENALPIFNTAAATFKLLPK